MAKTKKSGRQDRALRTEQAEWLNRRRARQRQLREARLERWAMWIRQAKAMGGGREVAEAIANQAMVLCGLNDDSVILDGDPPREQ